MSDVLSQAEIDALLGALSDGTIDKDVIEVSNPQKVKVYDFKRPNKFSKGHLNSLLNIHENFCRGLATFLAGNLHVGVEVKILTIEQVTYDEYIRSLPFPTILGIYNMSPLEGNALFELGSSLAFTIVDRLLGGQGTQQIKNRDLTEIERRILESRLSQIVSLIGEAWTDMYPISPKLVNMETNPLFTQIVAPNEIVVVITMSVEIGQSQGMINICLPYIVMKPILDKLNNLFLFFSQERRTSPENKEMIRKKIEMAKVPVQVLVGRTQITIQELLELEPGDVILLDQEINQPMQIYIGKFPKFMGVPGLRGNHMAVQITQVKAEGGNKNE
ncbi:MAG: flagellar motor switch protein FliM [Bacillota bacterium]|jgi:flagellar motor switch protein FliM